MLYQHLIVGGFWWMLPIYILWVVVLVLTIAMAIKYFKSNTNNKKLRELTLFLGSLAFFWGIFGQIIGLLGAMSAIEAVGEISPSLLAGGFKVSMYTTTYGFALFIVSFIVWFIARRLSQE